VLEVGSNKDVAKYFQCSNIKEHKVVQSLLDTLATKAMIEAAYICFWGFTPRKINSLSNQTEVGDIC